MPQGANIDDFKRNSAPTVLLGWWNETEEGGNYKRNNASLVRRNLIFLDYDELEAKHRLS